LAAGSSEISAARSISIGPRFPRVLDDSAEVADDPPMREQRSPVRGDLANEPGDLVGAGIPFGLPVGHLVHA
jgi:hypothetical protein